MHIFMCMFINCCKDSVVYWYTYKVFYFIFDEVFLSYLTYMYISLYSSQQECKCVDL